MSAPGMQNLNDSRPMGLLTEADFPKAGRRRASEGEIVARVALVLVLCIAASVLAVHWGLRA